MDDLDRFDRTARRVAWTGPHTEVRDPRAATVSLQWVGRNQPQVNRWQARYATRTWLQSWVVARCVSIRAGDLAARVFRVGDPTTGKINPNSALARLLSPPPGGPTPNITARRWWAWMAAQRHVTGQMAAELDRGGNPDAIPLALWPMAPAALTAIPADGGTDWFAGFSYGRPGEERRFSPRDVFYDWQPSLEDFRQPWPTIASAQLDVDVAVQLGRYQFAFLRNGGVPAHVVITERFPTDTARRAFEAKFAADYGGAGNAGKVAVVEVDEGDGPVAEAISILPVGLSQKDSQLLEQHRQTLEHVAMALGVPWSRLSSADRTYSNASEEARTYWVQIEQDAHDLADAVNLQLAPLYGDDLGWFDFSDIDVLRTTRWQIDTPDALLALGVVSVNEVRADLGLEPVDGGDDLTTMTPSAAAPMVAEEDPEEDPEDPEDTPPPLPAAARTTTRQADSEQRARMTAEERAAAYQRIDATLTTLEGRWRTATARLLARQRDSVVKALQGKRGAKLLRAPSPQIDPSTLFNRRYWRDETGVWAAPLYEDVFTAGATSLAATYGVSFDVADPRAARFAQSRANQLADQITDTTYTAIQDALAEAIMNGDDLDTITATITGLFDGWSRSRPDTIARTEVIGAYNGSQAEMATWPEMQDLIGGLEWLATPDARTRDSHAEVDGVIVTPGDLFPNGLAYPGDPSGDPGEVINCRCTVLTVPPEDMPRSRLVDIRTARALIAAGVTGEQAATILRSAA